MFVIMAPAEKKRTNLHHEADDEDDEKSGCGRLNRVVGDVVSGMTLLQKHQEIRVLEGVVSSWAGVLPSSNPAMER